MTSAQPIKLVTSMSRDMYEQFGKKMIESTIKHWPGELYVYFKGSENKPPKKYPGVTYKNLNTVPGFREFDQATSFFHVMRGQINNQYEYRTNVHTFAMKTFAQMDAAVDFDGLLFWIDADTFTVEDVSENWLRGIMADTYMAYMGRREWHSCASFVGWNCNHQHNVPFWSQYADLLMSGRFLLLEEWHDSFLNDVIREGMQIAAKDLADGLPLRKGPVNVFDAVFAGKAHHYKGNKKKGPQRYAQLIELVRQLQPEVVVEIGTWNGNRAVEMAQAAPAMRYYGFDLFEEATPQTDEEEKNVKPHFDRWQVQEALIKSGVAASLVPGNTKESLPKFIALNPELKADLIYIDGGHAVETIRSDFENAKKMVKPGGVIVFDDYYVDMPEEDLDKWGANRVLEEDGCLYERLPIVDPVVGGGGTQLAVVRC